MGFWSNIFGKGKKSIKGPTKEELYAKTENLLREVENKLIQGNLKSAMKSLEEIPAEATICMTAMNCPFHEQFANLVLKCIYQKRLNLKKPTTAVQYKDLPSLIVIVVGREANTLREVIDFVKNVDKELVYIVDVDEMRSYRVDSIMKSYGVDPRSKDIDDFILGDIYDIEILYEFAVDPHIIAMSPQPWDMFIRRSFLLSKASDLRFDAKIEIEKVFEEIEKQEDIGYEHDDGTISGHPLFKCYREI